MDIELLKETRISKDLRLMPIAVITLTGGAAAYCIYRGAQEVVKKVDEKKNEKRSGIVLPANDNAPSYCAANSNICRFFEMSISDICI